jgi:hypothetical protein
LTVIRPLTGIWFFEGATYVRGLLVRVGIDSTYGKWNAPVRNATREFAYVSIPEEATERLRGGMIRYYDEFIPVVTQFAQALPEPLHGRPTHLDPDFESLTYGDQGQRGRLITTLAEDDFLVFYAGLRPIDGPSHPLFYAIIGFYVIEEIVPAMGIAPERWPENAHTRRVPGIHDIVVRAKRGVSGRLRLAIRIGTWRNGAYRVLPDLLTGWGDLSVRDGYIQRSARLPEFRDAEMFYRWFLAQRPELVAENNLNP